MLLDFTKEYILFIKSCSNYLMIQKIVKRSFKIDLEELFETILQK